MRANNSPLLSVQKDDEQIEELKEELKQSKLKIDNMDKVIIELTAIADKYKNRGAGRKSKIDDDIIRAVTMLKLKNKSVRAISKEVGLSLGTVHKIIKEHIEEV